MTLPLAPAASQHDGRKPMDNGSRTQLPLIFTYRDLVTGNGFLATVAVRGRALATIEGHDDVWLESIQPGGFAAGGTTLTEAHAEFRQSFTGILIDIASDADTFEAFKTGVEEFCGEINAAGLADWHAAVATIRAAADFEQGLPVLSAELNPYVTVTLKSEADLTPKDNPSIEAEPALAA